MPMGLLQGAAFLMAAEGAESFALLCFSTDQHYCMQKKVRTALTGSAGLSRPHDARPHASYSHQCSRRGSPD